MEKVSFDDAFMLIEGTTTAKCTVCGKSLAFSVDPYGRGSSYSNLYDHAKREHGKEVERRRSGRVSAADPDRPCPYCFGEYSAGAIQSHIRKSCKAKSEFQLGGVGRTLAQLTPKNRKQYEEARKRFEQYCEAVAESGVPHAVYIAFVEDINHRVKRIFYPGQTTQVRIRWGRHIKNGAFEKLNVPAITFAWVKQNMSQQAASTLEAAVQMLLLTPSKKSKCNARFDSAFVANHTLLGATFEEAVQTQLMAASLYIVEALQADPKLRKTLQIDQAKKERKRRQLKKASTDKKKLANYDEMAEAYDKLVAALCKAGEPMPSDCPDPSLFAIDEEGSSQSQQGSSQQSNYSDRSFAVQDILEQLNEAAELDAGEPQRKRSRTDGPSTSTMDSATGDDEEELTETGEQSDAFSDEDI